jgi:lambda family phage minor tail protein L
LTRRRTLKKYLDGEPGADPTAEFPADVWEISKKMGEDKLSITFELHPFIDREGRKIPGRVILRDTCSFLYRYYDSGFVYPAPVNSESCPYTGSSYWKRDGSSTGDPALDDCGKRVSDCKLRFGTHDDLPYLAFPGVGITKRG